MRASPWTFDSYNYTYIYLLSFCSPIVFSSGCTVNRLKLFSSGCTVKRLKLFPSGCTVNRLKLFSSGCTVNRLKIFSSGCTVNRLKIFSSGCTVNRLKNSHPGLPLTDWNYSLSLQATDEKIEMTDLQNNNRQILCNLLPAHVAAHFIDNQNKSHMVKRYLFIFIMPIVFIFVGVLSVSTNQDQLQFVKFKLINYIGLFFLSQYP